jgi:hypothetical protein
MISWNLLTRAYPEPDETNSHTAGTVKDICECSEEVNLGDHLMHSPEFTVLIEQTYKLLLLLLLLYIG